MQVKLVYLQAISALHETIPSILKAGTHCDISININLSIRIVTVNRRNISISTSIRNGNFSIFLCLCLCLCCYVACVNRSCISINISISISAVFLSAEKHESRDQSRSKNVKRWGLNLKKNWQRLYENIAVCTINSLPTSKINPRESSCTR